MNGPAASLFGRKLISSFGNGIRIKLEKLATQAVNPTAEPETRETGTDSLTDKTARALKASNLTRNKCKTIALTGKRLKLRPSPHQINQNSGGLLSLRHERVRAKRHFAALSPPLLRDAPDTQRFLLSPESISRSGLPPGTPHACSIVLASRSVCGICRLVCVSLVCWSWAGAASCAKRSCRWSGACCSSPQLWGPPPPEVFSIDMLADLWLVCQH